MRRRLVEMTRTITVLRVNEKILARKYTIGQQVETGLRQVLICLVLSQSEVLQHILTQYSAFDLLNTCLSSELFLNICNKHSNNSIQTPL